jgi:hypothetical protein
VNEFAVNQRDLGHSHRKNFEIAGCRRRSRIGFGGSIQQAVGARCDIDECTRTSVYDDPMVRVIAGNRLVDIFTDPCQLTLELDQQADETRQGHEGGREQHG